MKKLKELKANPFFKKLIENAAGFSVDGNVIKVFNVDDEVNETILKNRLPNVKNVIVKSKLIKIIV